jgi:hypothetical protein
MRSHSFSYQPHRPLRSNAQATAHSRPQKQYAGCDECPISHQPIRQSAPVRLAGSYARWSCVACAFCAARSSASSICECSARFDAPIGQLLCTLCTLCMHCARVLYLMLDLAEHVRRQGRGGGLQWGAAVHVQRMAIFVVDITQQLSHAADLRQAAVSSTAMQAAQAQGVLTCPLAVATWRSVERAGSPPRKLGAAPAPRASASSLSHPARAWVQRAPR